MMQKSINHTFFSKNNRKAYWADLFLNSENFLSHSQRWCISTKFRWYFHLFILRLIQQNLH